MNLQGMQKYNKKKFGEKNRKLIKLKFLWTKIGRQLDILKIYN